jgi:hypothetical protein
MWLMVADLFGGVGLEGLRVSWCCPGWRITAEKAAGLNAAKAAGLKSSAPRYMAGCAKLVLEVMFATDFNFACWRSGWVRDAAGWRGAVRRAISAQEEGK